MLGLRFSSSSSQSCTPWYWADLLGFPAPSSLDRLPSLLTGDSITGILYCTTVHEVEHVFHKSTAEVRLQARRTKLTTYLCKSELLHKDAQIAGHRIQEKQLSYFSQIALSCQSVFNNPHSPVFNVKFYVAVIQTVISSFVLTLLPVPQEPTNGWGMCPITGK